MRRQSPGGTGSITMPRYYLYRGHTHVQVIRHYRNRGMPERRGRRLAGAPRSGNEIFVWGLPDFWWTLPNHQNNCLCRVVPLVFHSTWGYPGLGRYLRDQFILSSRRFIKKIVRKTCVIQETGPGKELVSIPALQDYSDGTLRISGYPEPAGRIQ